MRLYNYSNGIAGGYFRNGEELQKAHGKGIVRPYKSMISEPEEIASIPDGWRQCEDDRTAIERIPTMRDLVRALT